MASLSRRQVSGANANRRDPGCCLRGTTGKSLQRHVKPIGFVQPSMQKYFSFAFPEIMIYFSASRADTRGVRVVTNVVRNAVDVKGPGDDRL